MLKYVFTAVGGITVGFVAGIFFEKLMKKLEGKRIVESTKLLIECFGEPMYSSTFNIEDVTNWVECKKEKLIDGNKVAVIKTSKKLVEKYCNNIHISQDIENYLILTIVSADQEIAESILIKFDNLEPELAGLLDKGDGVLIVED